MTTTEHTHAYVMITMDRHPGPNYLHQTLTSLAPSRLPENSLLALFDSRPHNQQRPRHHCDLMLSTGLKRIFYPTDSRGRIQANENASAALSWGAKHSSEWVIFLEDDLLFCADFFNSIQRWLSKHAKMNRRIYSFGCAYPQVENKGELNHECWDHYAIESFYGTQCFAVRREDAVDLAAYLLHQCFAERFKPGEYDLGIAHWHSVRYPELGYFSASCPSFVQHIGTHSSIRPDSEPFNFPSWPGPEWSYNP